MRFTTKGRHEVSENVSTTDWAPIAKLIRIVNAEYCIFAGACSVRNELSFSNPPASLNSLEG